MNGTPICEDGESLAQGLEAWVDDVEGEVRGTRGLVSGERELGEYDALHLVPSLNAHPAWVNAVAGWIRARA